MLRCFKVKNFKGFKDWISLDLESQNNYAFNTDCIKDTLVKTALLYGYNGSGKSNIGLAIFDIVSHLTDKRTDKSLYQNFQNGHDCEGLVEFIYTFQFGDTILEYQYGKENVDSIVYEKLYIQNEEIVFFDKRNNDSEFISRLSGTENLNKAIKELRISVIKYIKSNSVLESNSENTMFYAFTDFVDKMLMFWALDTKSYIGYENDSGDIIQDIIKNDRVKDFKTFLEDFKLDNNILVKEIGGKKNFLYEFEDYQINFYQAASTGVRSLTLFYYWYERMRTNKNRPSFIFIDEFDAFYHSDISELIISLLKKLDIQVILTTHNSNLMSNDLLRPDCCFLVSKNEIAPFSKRVEKELRLAHNIEKMYRAGAFE